jgi:hypothetical protein
MMDRVASGSRQVWVGDMPTLGGFASPFGGAKFAVMVAALEDVPAVDRVHLARSLVEQGCRYAVCFGVNCDKWETVFDDVDVEVNPHGEAS